MNNNHIIEYNKSLRKPEGWLCTTCHQKFETRAVLLEHRRQVHKVRQNYNYNKIIFGNVNTVIQCLKHVNYFMNIIKNVLTERINQLIL